MRVVREAVGVSVEEMEAVEVSVEGMEASVEGVEAAVMMEMAVVVSKYN